MKPGFYTLQLFDEEPTVGQVIEGDPEVYILAYCFVYLVGNVFGLGSPWKVLAGPYELPGTSPLSGQNDGYEGVPQADWPWP